MRRLSLLFLLCVSAFAGFAQTTSYCIPVIQYGNQYAYINSVQLGTINNVTGQNAAAPNSYYSYISAPAANQTTTLAQGSAQTITITPFGPGNSAVSIWIDFNADGDFSDAGEQVVVTPANLGNNAISFPFTVPATAVLGPTRLRICEAYQYSIPNPCTSTMYYGETEDYTVSITAPCTGGLTPGSTVTSNADLVCSSTSFNLSVTPAPVASDISYQWEVSTVGATGPFAPITDKTGTTATITGQTQTSWYRLASRCTSTGETGASSAVQVTQQAAADCYCTPEIGYDNGLGFIQSVQLGTINNVSGQNYVGPQDKRIFYFSYVNATAANQTTNLAQGSSQTITISVTGEYGTTSNSVAAWIDFNGDGDFYDAGEKIGAAGNLPNGAISFTFTVPATAVEGATRLRVRESRMFWDYPNPVSDPCSFMRTWGESEDYAVTITAPCTGSNITLYRDADGDSFGNRTLTLTACSSDALPDGWVADSTDCNDNDGSKHASYNFYVDQDGDGYGLGTLVSMCAADAATPPAGYSLTNTDCDDSNGTVWRTSTFYFDADGDGYTVGNGQNLCYGDTAPAGYTSTKSAADDCNDSDASIWQSGIFYVDIDSDGFTTGEGQSICYGATVPSGYRSARSSNDDCDDADNTKWRSQTLYVDNDGDGYTTNNGVMVCYGASVPTGYQDAKSTVADCNDNNASVWQAQTWYQDADGDQHASAVQVSCDQPTGSGWTTNTLPEGDCNDADNSVWRTGTFYLDEDGDGYTVGVGVSLCYGAATPTGYKTAGSATPDCDDTNAAIGAAVYWYLDADNDGYYTGSAVVRCSAPGLGYKSSGLKGANDCNDADPTIHPGAIEICGDGKDNNCNGSTDEGCITTSRISINDVIVYESQGTAQLTVSLSARSSQTVKVTYASQDGTAVTTGKYKDYKAVKGTLTIAAGSLTGTITIPIVKDNLAEGNQYFTVLLSKPTAGVILADASGLVTIKDGAPTTTTTVRTELSVIPYNETALALAVQALPNPSVTQFNLVIRSASDKAVTINVTDASGRRVESHAGVPANTTFKFGSDYRPGMYVVQVIQGSERATLKLLKQAN